MTSRLDATENNFTLLRLLLALLVVLGHFKLLSGTAYPAFPFNLAPQGGRLVLCGQWLSDHPQL
jgi:hypothetical protein